MIDQEFIRPGIHFVAKRLKDAGVMDDASPEQLAMLIDAAKAWFMQMEPNDEASELSKWAFEHIRRACTIEGEQPHQTITLHTLVGAATALEHYSTLSRYASAMYASQSTWPKWFCPGCMNIYPEDFEPDDCPTCGFRLIRSRIESINSGLVGDAEGNA